ncbi:MAG: polynucleotide adenylyltransferase [Candidatus Pacearchaeota archaeon]
MKIFDIQNILSAICNKGGMPRVVGGFVRDSFLGKDSKDFDIEVYNMPVEELKEVLSPFGSVEEVGKSFGVLKLRYRGDDIDFSLPRRESKEGQGHKGFIVTPDANMTPEEAASRRDFTINTMLMNPFTGEVVDFFGGKEDAIAGILRHTSVHFAEDPLRVLRSMQFAGRFDMVLAKETAEFCKTLKNEFHTLPVERVWVEWEKWATKSERPSKGIIALIESGWLELFPELSVLQGLEQEHRHHPEGEALFHTMHCVDAAVAIANRDNLDTEERLVLVLATLCHDFGKATTTKVRDGKITTYGHDVEGEAPTRSFLARIGCPQKFVDRIVMLVTTHMFHVFVQDNIADKVVRRFASKLGNVTNVQEWARVVEADHSGRPPLPGGLPDIAKKIVEMSKDMQIVSGPPTPILMGRHLIEVFKMTPGKDMGMLLKKAMQAQLDGEFGNLEEAFNWVEKQNWLQRK